MSKLQKLSFLACSISLEIFLFVSLTSSKQLSNRVEDYFNLDCLGGNQTYYNVTLSAYYPFYEQSEEQYYTDMQGKKLRTVQDFLEGRSNSTTVGMDPDLKIPYGTPVCIPELNRAFNKRIFLQVRDDGVDMDDAGYNCIDICVDTEESALQPKFNMKNVTLVF